MLTFIMTGYTSADLLMADRHIARGELQIAGQEALMTTLILEGACTVEADALLKLLNEAQVQHYAHRNAIVEALGKRD